MRLLDGEPLQPGDWEALVDGEREPWGASGEGLRWQPKTRVLRLLDDDGALVGTGGALVAHVRVGASRLDVVGLGGIFVTRRARGRGLSLLLIERLLEVAHELGPARAMLFCLPSRMPLYARFGFREIERPVRAAQPDGPVTVPMRTMWRELTEGAGWPPGDVEVMGEPF